MISTIAKYHENLLKDSTLSLRFTVKISSSLEAKMILKKPNETFLRITLYSPLLRAWEQEECISIASSAEQTSERVVQAIKGAVKQVAQLSMRRFYALSYRTVWIR